MAAPLTIRFASDVDSAKRGIASLATTVATNAISMATTLKAVNDNAEKVSSVMSKLPGAASGLLGAVAGFLALKAVIDLTNAAAEAANRRLEETLKIASSAQAAGVGTTFFQGLTLQAKELQTEAGKLEGMLTRAREASTVKIGEGDKDASSIIGDRLKQNVLAGNLTQAAADRFSSAGSQEERIRVILELIEQLRQKGAQLAAFDLGAKMFGPEFERQLRDGVDIIGAMRQALDGLATAGGERVKSEQEIADAQRIQKTLAEAQKVLAEAMVPIQRDIANWENQQALALADLKKNFAEMVALAASLYKWVSDLGDKFAALGSLPIWDKLYNILPHTGDIHILTPEEKRALQVKPANPADAIAPRAGEDTSVTLPSLSPKKERQEADPIQTYISGLQKSTAALKAEVEAYGQSNAVKSQAIALAKAEAIAKENNRTLTEAEISQIKALGQAAGEAKDRMAELQAASARAAEATRAFGDLAANSIADAVLQGKSFRDICKDIVNQLVRWSLQATLTGSGPLAGMFGTAPAAGATGASSVGGIFGALGSLFGKPTAAATATVNAGVVNVNGGTTGATAAGTPAAAGAARVATPSSASSAKDEDDEDTPTSALPKGANVITVKPRSYSPAGPSTPETPADTPSAPDVPLPPIRPSFGAPSTPMTIDVKPSPSSYSFAPGPMSRADGYDPGFDPGMVAGMGNQLRLKALDLQSDRNALSRFTTPTKTQDRLDTGPAAPSVPGPGAELEEVSSSVKTAGTELESSFSDVTDALRSGGSELGDAFKQVASAFSSSSSSNGPGFNLAGLFGGSGNGTGGGSEIGYNADGTDDWRGGLSWVGERGPELVNLPKGAQVIPSVKSLSLAAPRIAPMAQAAPSLSLNPNVSIVQHISGNGDGTVAEISRQAASGAIATYHRQLQRTLPGMMSDANLRYG